MRVGLYSTIARLNQYCSPMPPGVTLRSLLSKLTIVPTTVSDQSFFLSLWMLDQWDMYEDGLYPIIARINHSCSPNATWSYTLPCIR